MTHAKSRLTADGKLIQLEHMTPEQLDAVSQEYKLSTEGTPAEKTARIVEYETKTGKTLQPHHFGNSQASTQPQVTHPVQKDMHKVTTAEPVLENTSKELHTAKTHHSK